MSKATRGFLTTAFVWVLVIGLGTAGSHYYKKWVIKERQVASAQIESLYLEFQNQWQEALNTCADTPSVEAYAKRAPTFYQGQLKERLKGFDDTQKKKHPRIKLAYDSFSGYCVFRSREFQNRLAEQDILVHLVDDNADYKKRIQSLKDGDTPLAVFTVDALINNSALFDAAPAAIVMVIDESLGADAMVSYRDALPNIQAMNRGDVKIVLTPDSPSETLARLVRFNYNLPDLPKECFIQEDGAQKVYERFKKTDPKEPTAFVLWEPFASQLLQEYPQAHKLLDSADPKCRGYIVDVLVVQKEFLQKKKQVVEDIVKTYLAATAAHQQTPEGMLKLVQVDSTNLAAAGKLPKDLTYDEAGKVVRAIRWKNTKDNYAHFGLVDGGAEQILPLPEMIGKITTVLVKTKAIGGGFKQELVDKEICASLQKEGFDESKGILVVPPPVFDPSKDWKQLKPVPGITRDPISFRVGSFALSMDSIEQLQEIANSMKSQSDYYLGIHGLHRGDAAADVDLAQKRADEVLRWLRETGGVEAKRMKALTERTTEPARTVTFSFLKPPH